VKRLIIALTLVFVILLTTCACSGEAADKDLKVGVLLDINGQVYEAGKAFNAGIELAAEDINHYLQDNGFSKRIRLLVEDTRGQPQIASQKIESLKAKEIIPVFCGSSGETSALLDYARKNNLILLSGFSTAPSLSKNDNLFRFCMNDNQQARALVRFARETGTQSVIVVYRDDVYGNDLKTRIMQTGQQTGLDIDQEEKYNPDETDFTALTKKVEQKLQQEKAENPGSQAAVILISMNEVVDIFKAAAGSAELESARWIGCDAVAPDSTLFADGTVLDFARKTGYTVCNFGVDVARVKEPFSDVPRRLISKTGTDEVSASAYYYYDAMWVLAQSWLNTAKIDYTLLKNNIPGVAQTMSVCSDEIGMDESGDRRCGQYDFWALKNGKFEKSANIVFSTWNTAGQFTRY
jgi:branched-chain amino acid transport system substrate-binding protein